MREKEGGGSERLAVVAVNLPSEGVAEEKENVSRAQGPANAISTHKMLDCTRNEVSYARRTRRKVRTGMVGYTSCMLQSWCCLASNSGVGYTKGWSSQS